MPRFSQGHAGGDRRRLPFDRRRRPTANALTVASVVLLLLSTGEITADLSYVFLILSSALLAGTAPQKVKPLTIDFRALPWVRERSSRFGK